MNLQLSYYISNVRGSEEIVARVWYKNARKKTNKLIVFTSNYSHSFLKNESNYIKYIVHDNFLLYLFRKIFRDNVFHRLNFIIWTISIQFFILRRLNLNKYLIHFVTPVQGFIFYFIGHFVKSKIIIGPKYFFTPSYSNILSILKSIFSLLFSNLFISLQKTALKKGDIFLISNIGSGLHTHSGIPDVIISELGGINTLKDIDCVTSGRDIPIKRLRFNFDVLNHLSLNTNLLSNFFSDNYLDYQPNLNNLISKPLLNRELYLDHVARGKVFLFSSNEQGGVACIEAAILGLAVICSVCGGYYKMAQPSVDALINIHDDASAVAKKIYNLVSNDNYINENKLQRERLFETCGSGVLNDFINRNYLW